MINLHENIDEHLPQITPEEVSDDQVIEEIWQLKEELKDLDIDLKDLDIELEKLDGFIYDLKEELESDGLIDDKDDEIHLELNRDEMLINGQLVPNELFSKYKDMYEEHLGRKLDDDHNLIIR